MVTQGDRDVFRGVADPVRRALLESLGDGGRSVAELAAGFPISRPAISKHLRVLKESGLVTEHRRGRRRIYELVAEPLERVVAWAAAVAEGTVIAGAPSPEPSETRSSRPRSRALPDPSKPPAEPDESAWREW